MLNRPSFYKEHLHAKTASSNLQGRKNVTILAASTMISIFLPSLGEHMEELLNNPKETRWAGRQEQILCPRLPENNTWNSTCRFHSSDQSGTTIWQRPLGRCSPLVQKHGTYSYLYPSVALALLCQRHVWAWTVSKICSAGMLLNFSTLTCTVQLR